MGNNGYRTIWIVIAALLLGIVCWGPAAAAEKGGEEMDLQVTDVYVRGEGGYFAFRIPALVVSKEGTLLAFAEGRVNNITDTGDIDTVLKRSFDNGRTWGPIQVVCNDGENTCGNPTAVVDEDTGRIWLFLTHNIGADTQTMISNGTSQGVRTIWSTYSDDDGETWSEPVNRFEEVQNPRTRWDATGPGTGIQLRHGPNQGRLIIPAIGRNIHSDDHGETWVESGRLPDGTSEAAIVELTDGRLLRNDRPVSNKHLNRRPITVSRDQGDTWSNIRYAPELVDPIVQGSMTRLLPSDHPSGDRTLLFANPASDGNRENMTVRMSPDDGDTWPIAKTVHRGPAGYSSLAALPGPERIGLLFEGGERVYNERLIFADFSLEWLMTEAPVLEALYFNAGQLSPPLTTDVYDYDLYGADLSGLTLTPYAKAKDAVIRVNGQEAVNGSPAAVALAGESRIEIDIQSGRYSQTYRITVRHADSRPSGLEPAIQWDFEGTQVDRVIDPREGQGADGLLKNGAALEEGLIGQGLRLDGSGAHVELTEGELFHTGTDDFAMAMWINPADSGVSHRFLFWYGTVGASNPQWWLRVEQNGSLRMTMNGVPANGEFSVISDPGLIRPNTWTHIAAVREGSLLNLYINGQRLKSSTPFDSAQYNINNDGQPPTLGYDKNQNQSRHWNGLIDELAFYRHALLADEVEALYKRGLAAVTGEDRSPPGEPGMEDGQADAAESVQDNEEAGDRTTHAGEVSAGVWILGAGAAAGLAGVLGFVIRLLQRKAGSNLKS